jgi:glyoxylase-like metal-dependent hydrolase (beta-lactamase superfamily II)
MRQKNHELPTSDHFELHQIAEGVYAAIGIEGGAAYSNAGIIDLGDRTLILDTFETPKAAEDLKNAAEHLTGRPASCIIISHAHDDHWLGNQVFADHTPIIATHKTRAEMSVRAEDIRDLQENPSELEEMIQEDEDRLKTETDERKRASIKNSILRYQYALEMLPTLELRLPNQTFERMLIFHGSQRLAELQTLGEGHTVSDCYLDLPVNKIAFMGDLGFFQCQPFMAYCNPEAWKAQLEMFEGSDIETFVPGHGPLGTKEDIALQKRYITVLEELVGRIVREGRSVEEALQLSLPEPFDAWLSGGMARFEANVRSSYERFSVE